MIDIQTIKEILQYRKSTLVHSVEQNMEYDLWTPEELDELNKIYSVNEFIPGYVAIGSDGGGEMLAVELETEIVYSIPFVPMNINERLMISSSIRDL
jgi:hypothetical protein